jgi:hypothetical protein
VKHTGKTIDMYRYVRGCQLKLPQGKKQGPWLRLYAVARRAKPKAWAKVAGRPWRMTESLGASDGRELRAKCTVLSIISVTKLVNQRH